VRKRRKESFEIPDSILEVLGNISPGKGDFSKRIIV
jgi:hypothetical protein